MQTIPSNTAQSDRLLRLPEVEALVGLRKSSIYDAMRRGEFPMSVKLSRRLVGWPASVINEWIASRINAAIR
ncbi:MAG: AlpA family transcriptional regulator [Proteobacteria bacterium]|nr:AlpA family transcriptional regulator [Pseudomonadota bacterium]